MVFQIAQGGGIALFAGKEVLVDAQDPRTNRGMILTSLPLEVVEKIALHGSRSDALASAQATPVDAIQVLLINHLLETFTGSLPGLHARQPLAKREAAMQAASLAHLQIHDAAAETPVVMADDAAAPAFVSQTRASTPRARYRPGIPGRYRNRAAIALDVVNLVVG
jgi:hypothetical protein